MKALKKQNAELIELVKKDKENNDKVNTYLQAKVPDMSDYFPLKDSAALERFLDTSDGLYPLRRAEFSNMLLNIVDDKPKKIRAGILKSFFALEFIKCHTWPTNRYKFICNCPVFLSKNYLSLIMLVSFPLQETQAHG